MRPRANLAAWLGGGLLALVLLAALLAPWLAPYAPDAIDLPAQLSAPSAAHPLGADFYGRDLLSRILYGARVTLTVAAAAVSIAVILGAALGLMAGYSRGWLGQLCVGLIDLLLAFPALLLALVVVAVLGPGLPALAIAVGVAGIPAYARLVRSVVLTLRAAPYVEAAWAIGGTRGHIMRRHFVPGVVAPVASLATLDLGRAIISVAALGFLGLGVAPPQAEWGLMLFEGRGYLASAPWASVFPGFAITLVVLGVTVLGDALTE
jgi:ABC-type dipeptide/oligopeptide/nickel transport system permease subunit